MLAEVTNAGFWEEYFSLLTDPAHLALEITMIFIFDLLIGVLIWPQIKKFVIRKHDAKYHKENEHKFNDWRDEYG